MVDVRNKRVLWTAIPSDKASISNPERKVAVPWKRILVDVIKISDVAFVPDSKTIYLAVSIPSNSVAGTAARVWKMNTETGEIIGQWGDASPPEEYTRFVSAVCVSPDGRFVAVGTGPDGTIWLLSTKDGQRRILKHSKRSSVDIVSFSPDSSRLAAYAATDAGSIEIWKVSDTPNTPANAPPATPTRRAQ